MAFQIIYPCIYRHTLVKSGLSLWDTSIREQRGHRSPFPVDAPLYYFVIEPSAMEIVSSGVDPDTAALGLRSLTHVDFSTRSILLDPEPERDA